MTPQEKAEKLLNDMYFSKEAKQRAKNYMSLKGALEPKDVVLGYKTSLDAQMLDRIEPKQETIEEAIKREYETRKFNSDFPFDPQSFKLGAKWQQEQNDTSKVTRVEVIQHSPPYNGRAYTNYFAKDVEIQFQDNGATLKIFLK